MPSAFDPRNLQNGFVEFAQFLTGLSDGGDFWRQIGAAAGYFFDFDLLGFYCRESSGRWKACYASLPPGIREENVFTLEMQQTADAAAQTGFPCRMILYADGPCSAVAIPIAIENQSPAVMLVGHHAEEPLSDDLLHLYAAAAGLIGQTLARLNELSHLKRQADRLEQILAEQNSSPMIETFN
jgi:hypothetical protein